MKKGSTGSPSPRPEREITIAQKKSFLTALEQTGGALSIVAKSVGIPHSTLYAWRRADSVFDKAITQIESAAPEIIADTLFMEARKGNFKAQKYYLEHSHPRFKKQNKKRVDIHYHLGDPKIKGKASIEPLTDPADATIVDILWAERILSESSYAKNRKANEEGESAK